jgi:LmbE family N-acetylglucosaminyl deacetylase
MRPLTLGAVANRPRSILCLGAHSDDLEIGCGGTLLRLLTEWPGTSVHWVVFSADDTRAAEAREAAGAFLADAGERAVTVHGFRDGYFPAAPAEIKDLFEELKTAVDPDLVFTHRRDDDHQDHRMIGRLTWNTFRDHLIAEYEIPKYDGDLGRPNLYVPLPPEIAARKVELLMESFPSQRQKRWFRPEVFHGLMAVRSVECNAPGAAEAFHVRKMVM